VQEARLHLVQRFLEREARSSGGSSVAHVRRSSWVPREWMEVSACGNVSEWVSEWWVSEWVKEVRSLAEKEACSLHVILYVEAIIYTHTPNFFSWQKYFFKRQWLHNIICTLYTWLRCIAIQEPSHSTSRNRFRETK
jgi:hypothetical protein